METNRAKFIENGEKIESRKITFEEENLIVPMEIVQNDQSIEEEKE